MFKYTVITNTSQALDIIQRCDISLPVFCDTETEGLYGSCRLLQVYQPETMEEVYVLDFDEVSYDPIMKAILPLWTVYHNASYDFGTLNLTTARFDDTQWLARLAYPQWQAFSLDVVFSKLVGTSLYEGLDKSKLQKSGFLRGAYLSEAQLRYSAADVYALAQIWKDKEIQRCREILAYKVDIISLGYSVRYQQNGLLVDQGAVLKEIADVEEKLVLEYEQLKGINSKSTPQVKAEFLRLTGVEPTSTNKSYLVKQITGGGPSAEFAQIVFDNRRSRLRETNLHKYNAPRLITKFNPAGAATGRFTSKGGKDGSLPNSINAQNITRDLQYIMNQDTEDTVVVHADYSTAELRAGCSIMQDEGMYKELMAGKDLHKISAMLADASLTYDSVTKSDRQKGKAISFGFIFGMSATGFVDYAYESYGVKFSLEEAKRVKTAYQKKYPNITRYAAKKWDSYKTTINSTPQGHRAKAKLGTDAINHATQGCIAETVKLAVHYLVKEDNIVLDYLYNVVHDAIYLRVPKGDEEYWAKLLTDAMIKAWKETCKLPMLYYKDIPMPVEVEYNCSKTNKYIVKEVV